VARLRQARQSDSVTKTTRARGVVRDLLNAGQRISFARVAREADVSTWFVYNNSEIKAAVRDAMNDQTHHGVEVAATPRPERATPASLRTDLALAGEEIKDLKRERDALKHRVQLALGAEIDNVTQPDLVKRIQDLEHQNRVLAQELTQTRANADRLARQRDESEETITSLRLALRKAIRAVP
jgi:chromosome segregation ATPase